MNTFKNNIKVVCSTQQTEYLAEQFRKQHYTKRMNNMTNNRNDPRGNKKINGGCDNFNNKYSSY